MIVNPGELNGRTIRAIEIKLYRDGNKICALVGQDLVVGVAGFGDSVHEALRDLADNLIREACWVEVDDDARLAPLRVEPGSTIQTHQVELFRDVSGGVCAFVGRPDGNVGTWSVGDSTHDAIRRLADELVHQGIWVEVMARREWHLEEIDDE